MQLTEQVLEIRLEEFGEHSWWRALVNTVSNPYGSAMFRFAGRVEAAEDDSEDVVGATFPVMRFQSLEDTNEPNAWIDVAKERLVELDRTLQETGWRPLAERGPHWWSLRYARTTPAPELSETHAQVQNP